MNAALLSEVANITMGQSPPSSTYNSESKGLPFFQGKTDFGDMYPKIRMYCDTPNKIAQKGDILISVRAPVGPTNICPTKSCIGRGLAAIRGNSKADTQYLLYFLRFIEPELADIGRGSTFEAVSRSDLENVKIPLPSLLEQKRLAAILAKADRLRRLRRYGLAVSDTYLQTVFLEMFGKEAAQKWPRVKVSEVVAQKKNAIRTGPFGSQLLHSEFVDEGVAVLGIDNAVENSFAWKQARFITEEKYKQLERYRVFPDDLIITIMGTLGRCAVVPKNIPIAINTKHLCCITLDQSKCLPTYLHSCFTRHPDVLQQLGASERGAIMDGLNMDSSRILQFRCHRFPFSKNSPKSSRSMNGCGLSSGRRRGRRKGFFRRYCTGRFVGS